MNILKFPVLGRCLRFDLINDPRVYSIDGPMCRWSLRTRGLKNKTEFMRKRTRWITNSKEIAEVLRGDGRWKRDKRFVYMTGKSETVSEYPASLVVAMLKAINRQMISDGVIRIEEMHFAGPVLDEGDNPTELEGKWGVDGTWIDPKLLIAGRKEEMEYMMKMGVFEVVDEKECYDNGCKPLMLKWVDKMKGEKCRSRLVCREIKKARDQDEQLGPEDVFSPMPPSEGLKMLVSMMTGHDDENHVDGPFEKMATWDVSRAHFMVKLAGGFTHFYLKDMNMLASWPDFAEACTERVTQRQSVETHGQMC